MEQQWHLSVCIVHARRLYAQIHIGAMNLRRERKTKRDFLPISNTVSTSCRSWKLNVIITFALCWGTLEIQWNLVITYPQGKWKKARTNQSTFYPKRDFPHRQDRFHVFTRMICHGRCFSVLNVDHYPLFVRWNHLSGHREFVNVPGNWNRNWKVVGRHGRDQKKEPKKGQKVLLEGKMVCNIRFSAAFCTS